jgi:hypothetical protein
VLCDECRVIEVLPCLRRPLVSYFTAASPSPAVLWLDSGRLEPQSKLGVTLVRRSFVH